MLLLLQALSLTFKSWHNTEDRAQSATCSLADGAICIHFLLALNRVAYMIPDLIIISTWIFRIYYIILRQIYIKIINYISHNAIHIASSVTVIIILCHFDVGGIIVVTIINITTSWV